MKKTKREKSPGAAAEKSAFKNQNDSVEVTVRISRDDFKNLIDHVAHDRAGKLLVGVEAFNESPGCSWEIKNNEPKAVFTHPFHPIIRDDGSPSKRCQDCGKYENEHGEVTIK